MVLKLSSDQKRQLIDMTDKLDIPKGDGLLNIFVRHTTAAVSILDLDQGTDKDYLAALAELTPQRGWNHPHNPNHFPDHLWPAIIGCSLTLPFEDGRLLIGTWQRVVLIELDGPREREIVVSSLTND